MKETLHSEKKMRDRHTLLYRLVKDGTQNEDKLTLTNTFGAPSTSSVPKRDEILKEFGEIFDTEYQKHINDVEIDCVTHVAGHCARKVLNKLEKNGECSSCAEKFITGRGQIDVNAFHDEMQRGGLVSPSDEAQILTALGVSILIALTCNEDFGMKFVNFRHHRAILETLVFEGASEMASKVCQDCSRSVEPLIKGFIKPLGNTLLSGYSKMMTQDGKLKGGMKRAEKRRLSFEKLQESQPPTKCNRKLKIFTKS